METKNLKYFRAVYETHSINQAAKGLFISPQGLSRIIAQLEKEVGAALFERSNFGMIPTPGADLLYIRSAEILFQVDALERDLEIINTSSIKFRIGSSNGVFNIVPFKKVLKFTEENPQIQIEYSEYSNPEVKEMLLNNRLDCGLIVGNFENPEISTTKIKDCDIRLLVYEGHPLYEKKEISIEMLREQTLITMNEKFRLYHDFYDACKQHGFTPKILAKTADVNLQYTLCKNRMGLSIVPSFLTQSYNMDGFNAIPFKEDIRWEVYLAYGRSGSGESIAKAFEKYIINAI